MRIRRRSIEIVLSAIVLAAACGRNVPAPAERPLEILVTNDDGIEAPGIAALVEALRPLGTVTVAAPDVNRSGASHGVTSDRPIVVRESVRDGLRWLAIDALPATCVRLAVEELLPARPDIVVSGINRGENLGTVTFFSATVGAAREAGFLGVPAIAVNLVAARGMDFGTAAAVTAAIVRAVGRDGIAKGAFLNVNVPPLPLDAPQGTAAHPAGHAGAARVLRGDRPRRRRGRVQARLEASRAGRGGHRHLGRAQRLRLGLRVRLRPVGRRPARRLPDSAAPRTPHVPVIRRSIH